MKLMSFFSRALFLSALVTISLMSGCGSNSPGGGGGGQPPAAPAGLTATAGNAQVSLSWSASDGATSYHVKRSTTSGGEATIASPTTSSYTDTSVTNGTLYYYVVSAVNAYGESGNSSEKSATPVAPQPPPAPTALIATPGNAQVSLSWNASSGATSYNVKRSTTSGGESTIASATTNSYTDTSVTNGILYYYVVSAVNANGESANSSEQSATPQAPVTNVSVTIDVLTNRHLIGPYAYGAAYPQDAPTVTDLGLSVVRWGGNATSTYNWKLFTNNADNDWYFEDFGSSGFNGGSDPDSIQWVKDVITAKSNPLMTMVMLPWVANTAETPGTTGNGHWSFSIAKYGPQCSSDQWNTDAGNGQKPDCSTPIAVADPNDAYVPLLDDSTQTCPTSAKGPCIYRKDWAAALATAFGSAQHFYDMDNEIDIWGGTHRDVHPNPSGYGELRDVFLQSARNLKTWDPKAIRLGPVSCCWWFYWNGENTNDRAAHAGIDFLPWWLNEIYWQDQIDGIKSLDVFDIHAYPDGPDTSSYTQAQLQALATSIYRDYWDPTYPSPASSEFLYATSIEPVKLNPFRIPRMRAIVNMIYPGVPLAFTEWSAAFAGESDFSTALGDADAYGILGRERVYLASRWTAPSAGNPNYLALKLYTNYDGNHHGFAPISVSDTNNGNPNLFSSYAALSADGKTMTVMVLNKDPVNTASVQFSFAGNGFTPSTFTSYTLANSSPPTISASSSQSWSSTQNFAPYSATLLVIFGSTATPPASEWDLNPDTIMVAAGGSVTLNPKITSSSGSVTLGAPQSDTGITVTVTQSAITTTANGEVTVTAGSGTAPGFYHYSIPGTDASSVTQTQGGWIVVGNPAATFINPSGGGQGSPGSTLPLTVTLSPGQSGGSAAGACVLFTASAGSLSTAADPSSTCVNSTNTNTGLKVIAVTNSSGVASVNLTLPSSGSVTVTAEGQYGLGHPTLPTPFTVTVQ
jgi:hypothetical protein